MDSPEVSPGSSSWDTNRTNRTQSSGGKYESALFLTPPWNTSSEIKLQVQTSDLRSRSPGHPSRLDNFQGHIYPRSSCSIYDVSKLGQTTWLYRVSKFIFILPKEFRNFQFHLAEIELSGQLRIKPFFIVIWGWT